jgi:hypothetical protein
MNRGFVLSALGPTLAALCLTHAWARLSHGGAFGKRISFLRTLVHLIECCGHLLIPEVVPFGYGAINFGVGL